MGSDVSAAPDGEERMKRLLEYCHPKNTCWGCTDDECCTFAELVLASSIVRCLYPDPPEDENLIIGVFEDGPVEQPKWCPARTDRESK